MCSLFDCFKPKPKRQGRDEDSMPAHRPIQMIPPPSPRGGRSLGTRAMLGPEPAANGPNPAEQPSGWDLDGPGRLCINPVTGHYHRRDWSLPDEYYDQRSVHEIRVAAGHRPKRRPKRSKRDLKRMEQRMPLPDVSFDGSLRHKWVIDHWEEEEQLPMRLMEMEPIPMADLDMAGVGMAGVDMADLESMDMDHTPLDYEDPMDVWGQIELAPMPPIEERRAAYRERLREYSAAG